MKRLFAVALFATTFLAISCQKETSELLPAAVQAFVPARRSESRFRLSQSTGRLAYAQRCQCRNVAERMRRIITFHPFTGSFARLRLCVYTCRLTRTFTQGRTYIRVGLYVRSRRPARIYVWTPAYYRHFRHTHHR